MNEARAVLQFRLDPEYRRPKPQSVRLKKLRALVPGESRFDTPLGKLGLGLATAAAAYAAVSLIAVKGNFSRKQGGEIARMAPTSGSSVATAAPKPGVDYTATGSVGPKKDAPGSLAATLGLRKRAADQ